MKYILLFLNILNFMMLGVVLQSVDHKAEKATESRIVLIAMMVLNVMNIMYVA